MAARSRLILQCDWEKVLREENGKTWVTFSRPDGNKVHGELKCIGLSTDGNPYTQGSQGFAVPSISRYISTVTYNEGTHSCSCSFKAPSVGFTSIHNSRKQVHSLDVTAGGIGVSADSANTLVIWTTNNGEIRRKLEGHLGDVYTCKFFPSGVVILSGGSDMLLKIWSMETGQCAATLMGHHAGVTGTAFVERGRNIVSCSRDGTAKLWDVGQKACLSTFNLESGVVNGCAVDIVDSNLNLGTPDGTLCEQEVLTEGKMLLLACENGTLQGYGLQSKQKVFTLKCSDAVNCCSFLSSTLCLGGTQDGHVVVCDLRNTSTPLHSWKEGRGPILSLLAHKNGFFTTSGDGSCFYIDGETGSTISECTGPDCDPVYTMACDGTSLFTGCRDGIIRKYQL